MNVSSSLGALLLGAFSIAAMHALIPSHWLAFALVGRSQSWGTRRTLTVAALAGSGHILLTLALGVVVTAVGKSLLHWIPPKLEHAATAVLLIALGLYFAISSLRGRDVCCSPDDEDGNEGGSLSRRLAGTPTVMGALILGLTLSPCLDLLSVYAAASAFSWRVLIMISVIMSVTTLSIMLLLIWLTLHGLQRLNLGWLNRNEGLIVGSTLIVLGIILFMI